VIRGTEEKMRIHIYSIKRMYREKLGIYKETKKFLDERTGEMEIIGERMK
jgi:hypothetical protein